MDTTWKVKYGAEDGSAFVDEWDYFKNKWLRTIINVKAQATDEAVKKALIQLGWTPPKERNMSQQKQYPSIDEATHKWDEAYYKAGEETCYYWNKDKWVHSGFHVETIKQYATPLKTQQEAQQRTLDQPATTLQTPSSNSPSLPVQEVLEGIEDTRKKALDDLVAFSQEHGLYDTVGNPLVKPLIPNMTEKNGNATCDPTSPDNRQVGGDHYKRMKVQPWAALDDWLTSDQKVGYYLGSAVAYLARFNSEGVGKGGVQDVKKAKHYLEKLIDTLNKEKKEHE